MSEGFSVLRTTIALGVPRSLYYYHQKANTEEEGVGSRGRPPIGYSFTVLDSRISDEQIKEYLMEAIEGEEGIYGYRKLNHFLRKEYQLIINPKKTYRLCKELEILLPQRGKPSPHQKNWAKQHEITGPNQLWQIDIKYGSLENTGYFYFLASAIDVFDRSIVGYYRGPDCKAPSITMMLTQALMDRGVEIPEGKDEYSLIIRSDNGPQFLSKNFGEFCRVSKIFHERIPPKSPDLNAYIESFHSGLEKECYRRFNIQSYDEAYYRIDEYINFYNERRYHGSLGYLSPKQYLEAYQNQELLREETVRL
ncbi:IS3 family transposase [Bacillus sp. FJAT-42376]|uniref:IS3 family transposase n=1 Tax=Bacillus sp. FJAT-42376 TaxID=2014076 RepID=UPI0013DD91A5|nr:IS3 family transposase [Bacillus sp. FJAT-42376]